MFPELSKHIFQFIFPPTKCNSSHIWGRWYFKDVVVNKATMISLQWQSIWAHYSLEDLFPGKWGLVFPSLPSLLNCMVRILEINSHMCLMKASWASTKKPKSKTATVSVRKHCCLNIFHHKVLEQCAWHIVGAQEKLLKEWMHFRTFWNISGSNWVIQCVPLSPYCLLLWNHVERSLQMVPLEVFLLWQWIRHRSLLTSRLTFWF